jgi:hypothetical protein
MSQQILESWEPNINKEQRHTRSGTSEDRARSGTSEDRGRGGAPGPAHSLSHARGLRGHAGGPAWGPQTIRPAGTAHRPRGRPIGPGDRPGDRPVGRTARSCYGSVRPWQILTYRLEGRWQNLAPGLSISGGSCARTLWTSPSRPHRTPILGGLLHRRSSPGSLRGRSRQHRTINDPTIGRITQPIDS